MPFAGTRSKCNEAKRCEPRGTIRPCREGFAPTFHQMRRFAGIARVIDGRTIREPTNAVLALVYKLINNQACKISGLRAIMFVMHNF